MSFTDGDQLHDERTPRGHDRREIPTWYTKTSRFLQLLGQAKVLIPILLGLGGVVGFMAQGWAEARSARKATEAVEVTVGVLASRVTVAETKITESDTKLEKAVAFLEAWGRKACKDDRQQMEDFGVDCAALRVSLPRRGR